MDIFRIKSLGIDDLEEALRLIWEVFMEFEASEYSDEGVQEFKSFIELSAIVKMQSQAELSLWGCFEGDQIVGVIATKPPCHIALLFVDKRYHRLGIARTLYHTVLDDYKANSEHSIMTVHSSPYAVEAYRRLGFVDTEAEQVVNGLRFTPMKHIFR